MRAISLISALAAGAFLAFAPAAPSYAGGDGCEGKCYEEVPAPAIHRTFKRRITYFPGLYEIDREPSLYGIATKRVLLSDGVEWREKPAVYKTVRVRKHIGSKIRWEKRWVDGRHIMCKVRVPGETVWVDKEVLVSPARRWKVRSAPVYGYEQKRILLRNYKNIAVYHRARTKYVHERVTIQPESTIWVPLSGRHEHD